MFREILDVDYHESVAKEHLEQRMPVIQLARGHGIPLSAVRKWIALFREGGRPALEASVALLRKKYEKPLSRAQLEKLADQIRSDDIDVATGAIVTVGVRRIESLSSAVFQAFSNPHLTFDALLSLGDLGQFELLSQAEGLVGWQQQPWIETARLRAARARRNLP
jgi:transposase-like protein